MTTVRVCGDVEQGELLVQCACGKARQTDRPCGYRRASCERCPAVSQAPDHEAAGWLRCARKGGKVAWLCPTCRPVAPTSMGPSAGWNPPR